MGLPLVLVSVAIANSVDFLFDVAAAPGLGFHLSFGVVVVAEAMSTPPRALRFTFGRRIEATHVVNSVAVRAAQKAGRDVRVT